jgi:protein gp37
MSKIEWTGKTWNPITGCQRVSAGCQHCYAETMTKRLAAMGQEKYQGLLDGKGRFNGEVRFDRPSLDIPILRKKPTTYFVNSMSDIFHPGINHDWQRYIWVVMKNTPRHTYQILTKRAEEMQRRVDELVNEFGVLPNVWLGVSVENQAAADERIPHLLQTPAAIRFLSCEPLLGPVEIHRYAMGGLITTLDWVIVGGESGPGARPVHPDWARSLRDQCAAAGVPFFFKQWGEWGPEYQNPSSKMVRMGKKVAGCLLDGREWKEMPGAAS